MEADLDSFSQAFGPGAIDGMLRQAFKIAWLSLPKERQNLESLEAEMRRIFERIVRDFKDDDKVFALETDKGSGVKK